MASLPVESMDTDMNNHEENALNEQLQECLESINNLGLGPNLPLFKRNVHDLVRSSYLAYKPPSDPLKAMLNASITCGSILMEESKLWLEKIGARLRGKASIRHPYQCEIVRGMSFQVVKMLRDAILHTRIGEINTNVVHGSNKKCHIISFTSKEAVVLLLSMLSGRSESEVESRFQKTLKGRVNGKAEVIVSPEKDFAFIYRVKPSELTIAFHYGVWNRVGFPLHC